MEFVVEETQWLGKKAYHYETIDSTNKKAKELAEAGAAHGTIVTAAEQEAGVGRRGRSWSSEKGQGIYMSMILRPNIMAEKASMVTLVAAMAVAEAIYAIVKDCGIFPFIKWPNDIVIRSKKVCGILTEMTMKDGEIDYIIVGIGVNVHNREFSEEIAHMATSIELEIGHGVARESLAPLILQQFEKFYATFMETEDLSLLVDKYQQMSANKGRKVLVLDPKGEYEGTARGITNIGELIVDTPEGTNLVSSGEVSVRGIYGYV